MIIGSISSHCLTLNLANFCCCCWFRCLGRTIVWRRGSYYTSSAQDCHHPNNRVDTHANANTQTARRAPTDRLNNFIQITLIAGSKYLNFHSFYYLSLFYCFWFIFFSLNSISYLLTSVFFLSFFSQQLFLFPFSFLSPCLHRFTSKNNRSIESIFFSVGPWGPG